MFRKRFLLTGAAAVVALGGLAGCSSGSSDTATSPSPVESPSVAPSPSGDESLVVLDKQIQTELNAVGCHSGTVDGIMGPMTDQAIVRFQEAEGLPVDGEANARTIAALKKASTEGRTVCTTTTASPTMSPTMSPTASPTVAPIGAPCTSAALTEVLPSGAQLQSFVCASTGAERWAAGQYTSGPSVENFFAKAEGGTWKSVNSEEICGTASAGLPQKILDYCGLT